jgi:hypothetical protein
MTSIFIMSLKKLIKEQLSPLSASEKSKSESILHDKVLSLQQQTIIEQLSDDIVRFSLDADDKTCTEQIVELINKARKKVQPERESHKKLKDEGDTIKCLTQLALHANDLYKKLDDLKKDNPALYSFNLLDTPYKHNPLHVIYALAVYYIGEEIFCPNARIDVTMRNNKESKLAERIRALSERILPEHPLEFHKERAKEMLKDLATDNAEIIKQDPSLLATLASKITFWGMGFSLSTAGEGRLGRLIAVAKLTIEGMTAQEFEPLMQAEERGSRAAAAAPLDERRERAASFG